MNKTTLIAAAVLSTLTASAAFAQSKPSSTKMLDCIAREQARNGSSKGMATTTCEDQADSGATNAATGTSPRPANGNPPTQAPSAPATSSPASSPATPTPAQTQSPSPGPTLPPTSSGATPSGTAPASGTPAPAAGGTVR